MPVPPVMERMDIAIFWLIRNIGIVNISAASEFTIFKFLIGNIEKTAERLKSEMALPDAGSASAQVR